MKTHHGLLCAVALLVSMPANAGTYLIDQQQTVNNGGRGFFGFGDLIGQEFVPALGSITGADFYISSTPATVFTVTLRHATLNGDLSGAALGSATGTAPGPAGYVHFTLPLILLPAAPCTAVDLTGCYVLQLADISPNTNFSLGVDDFAFNRTLGSRLIEFGSPHAESSVFSEGTDVPEPSTWALLGLGIGSSLICRRVRSLVSYPRLVIKRRT